MENKTVLYCRNMNPSRVGVLNLSSPTYSRCLQLKNAGLDIVFVGMCDEDRTMKETVRGMRACFVNQKASGEHLVAQIRKAFPDCGPIPLVIARDLPSARASLRVAKTLKCPAYYESLETWTGYHVVDGKHVFPDYYRTYLRERLVVRRFRRMIVHSFPAMAYQRRLYGLDEDHIGVMYSALPIPEDDGSFPIFDSVDPNDRVIVCSGGLAPRRGLEELVTCFAYMPDGYKLLLAGEGTLKSKLEQIVAEKRIENKVLFQGNVPVTEYYKLLKKADIGIDFRSDSTLNYDLAMSCRVIDYINCGIPVICSSTQAFRDTEKRLGVIKCLSQGLSPRQQAEQIMRCADHLLHDKVLMSEHLQNARDMEFSFDLYDRKFASWLADDGII